MNGIGQYGNWCGQNPQFITSGGQGYTLGNVTISNGQNWQSGQNWHGQFNQGMQASDLQAQPLANLMAAQHQEQKHMFFSGTKPVVLCGGEAKEAKDMDDAQQIAESLAHSKSADAYILKPVKKVSPKRDVVTTDLS